MIMTTCIHCCWRSNSCSERKSWGDFVEERIMEPLEMNHKASFVRLKDSTNIIAPHVPINGKLKLNATKTNFLMLEFIPV
jgi:CubicO group peptidase (beta-lactamase class C family)